MDHTHLMIEFMNGELNPDLESEFFYNLSVSDEFRSRFKQLLSIERTIANNVEITAPSPELSGKVFSNLGFAYMPAPEPAPAASAPKPGFFTRNSGRIMTGLVSSLITAAVMFILFLPYMSNEPARMPANAGTTFASGSRNTSEPGTSMQKSEPVNASPESSSRSIAKQNTGRTGFNGGSAARNNVNPGRSQSTGSSELADNGSFTPERKSDIEKLIPINLKTSYDANVVYSPIQVENTDLKLNLNEPEQNESVNELGFIIEVRGTEAWMLPASTFQPSQSPKFLNKGLSLFYRLPDDYQLGLDIRHEDFFMKYRGMENQDYNFNYEQQSNFTSLGIVLRKPFFKINNFQPFAQLYLGGNYYGAVGRIMGGLVYSPTSDLSFMAGLEYSNMLFGHQGTLFSASKLGLNYGLLLRF